MDMPTLDTSMVCAPRSITTPSAPTADSFARASISRKGSRPCPKRVSPSQRYEFPTSPWLLSRTHLSPPGKHPAQVRASGDSTGWGVIIWRGALHPATRPTWYSSAAPRPSRPHWVSAGATATGVPRGIPVSADAAAPISPPMAPASTSGTSLTASPRSASRPPHQLRRWMSSSPASAARVVSLASTPVSRSRSQSASVTTNSISP